MQRARVDVLGTSGIIITTDPSDLAAATSIALGEIDAIDRSCSRFRADSDLSRVNRAAGNRVEVSDVFVEALTTALRAATVTSGDVDPTVGRAVRVLGYDRDFRTLDLDGPPVVCIPVAQRWTDILVDAVDRTVQVPEGVELDLGATAKALACDRAAGAASGAIGGRGVLVSLGGDISVAGPPPEGGWPILIGDRHDVDLSVPGPTVAIFGGGLATSGTAARRWLRGGVQMHHLIDPRTGGPVNEVWQTVTVAAASCVDANIASTASMIRGQAAVEWLEGLGLAARLVDASGEVALVGGWGSGAVSERVVA